MASENEGFWIAMRGRRRPTPPRRARSADLHGQSGVTLLELLVVATVAALVLAVSFAAMSQYYRDHALRGAAGRIQTLVRGARLAAVKEKTPYRLIFRDVNNASPNRVEVQELQSGSYVTLSDGTYVLAGGVRILGSGVTDSLDSLSIGKRGDCGAGGVYLQNGDGDLLTVAITSTCFTTVQ